MSPNSSVGYRRLATHVLVEAAVSNQEHVRVLKVKVKIIEFVLINLLNDVRLHLRVEHRELLVEPCQVNVQLVLLVLNGQLLILLFLYLVSYFVLLSLQLVPFFLSLFESLLLEIKLAVQLFVVAIQLL